MRFPINCNDSTAVWSLRVNPITRSVYVRWFNTPTKVYRYETRRRDMLPLLWYSGDTSKGQWVNRHCWAA